MSHEFNPQAEVDHFGFLVEEQTALLRVHTTLDEDVLKGTAYRNALILFNTTFASNVRSLFREAGRAEEVIGSEFTLIDGKLTAVGYGTPETMLERTKQMRPELYNEAEAQTILQGVKLIEEGHAQSFAYAMHHDSGTRYVAFFEKVGDRTWKPRSVDVGKGIGRDLTQTEGADVIRLLHERRPQDTKLIEKDTYPLLVIEEARRISAKDVAETSLMRSFLTSADPSKMGQSIYYKERSPRQPLEEVHEIPLKKVPDMLPQQASSFESHRDAGSSRIAEVVRSVEEVGKQIASDTVHVVGQAVTHIRESFNKKQQLPVPEKPSEPEPVVVINTKEKHVDKIKKKPPDRVIYSREEHRKHVVALSLVPVAHEYGLSVPILTILVQEFPKKEARIGKKQKRAKEKKNILVKSERTHKMIAKKEKKAKKKLVMKERHTSKKEVKKKRRMFRIVSRSDYMRPSIEKQKMRSEGVKRPDKRKKQKKINLTENPKRQHKEKQLIRVLSKLLQKRKPEFRKLRRERRQELREKRNITKQELPRRRKKEIVVQFAFSWVFLLLLKPLRFDVSIHRNKEHKGRKQESTQWILLSIIWHLAMIREAGKPPKRQDFRKSAKGGSAFGGKKTKKRTTRRAQIPMQAVIFAYIS